MRYFEVIGRARFRLPTVVIVDSRSKIDPRSFVEAVQPLLQAKDCTGLHALLCERWDSGQIISLLRHPDTEARKVAALSLALVGCRRCLPELAKLLKDPDLVTNQMAEHAMWSIWFRLGSPKANCLLRKGVEAMNKQDFPLAIEHFSAAIDDCEEFAEAWNQRATAYYLLEDFVRSISDARQAVARNPNHFGAWAGLGHCFAHLKRFDEAIEAYERALEINPNLECLAEAIAELRAY